MGSVGFLLTKSPAELSFRTFLDMVGVWKEENIHVYLVSNGVYAAMKKNKHSHFIKELSETESVFARKEDLISRGITPEMVIDGVEILEGFDRIVVDIMENLEMIFTF